MSVTQASPFASKTRLASLVQSLRSNLFLRRVGIMSGSAATGHLFTLAAGPLLTRIYGPAEFGALGLFTSFLSIGGVALTLQYELSIVVGADEREAAHLTLASLMLTLPMSMLSGVALWLLMLGKIAGFGGLPSFAPGLMFFSMLLIGLFTALRYWSLREGQFGWIAQATVVQSATRAILQAGLGAIGMLPSGLLLGEALGRGMGITRILRNAWPRLQQHALHSRWAEFKSALLKHRKFPLYSFPSSFLDALCLGLPLPMLVHLYGVPLGGYYSLVWKVITVPTVLIGVSIADTFHNSLATYARETPERVMQLFRSTSFGLLAIGLVPATLLLFFGPAMFRMVFGARWGISGAIAAVVAPWYLAQFVASPLSRVVFVLSGQEIKLLWDLLCLASLCGVFFFVQKTHLEPMHAIRLLSSVYAALFVVYYLILYNLVARFADQNAMVEATVLEG